jgi:hypothetical protein
VDLVGRHRGAGRARYVATVGALVLTQVVLVVQNQLGVYDFYRAWHAWALGGLYWWGVRHMPADEAAQPAMELGVDAHTKLAPGVSQR